MSSYVERLRITLEDVDRIAFKVVLWFIYTDKIYPYIKGEQSVLMSSLSSRTFKELYIRFLRRCNFMLSELVVCLCEYLVFDRENEVDLNYFLRRRTWSYKRSNEINDGCLQSRS